MSEIATPLEISLPDFNQWDQILQGAGQNLPCLVLDQERFLANLELARSRAQPGIGLRVVAKSLAALPMLDLAVEKLGAVGVMTFSAGMLQGLLQQRPQLDHLLGKPLPASAAAAVLDQQLNAPDQVIWLIDTFYRAQQYAALAAARAVTLRVAIELDVGLHRGGVDPADLAALVSEIQQMPALRLEGVMGYEPHLAKLPAPLHKRSKRLVDQGLKTAAELLQQAGVTQQSGQPALVNTGGSLTFANYSSVQGVSEISLGSVLVKPQDFTLPATEGFLPAMFIATPILKYRANNPLPGLEPLSRLLRWRHRANLAIYGGYWKATPVHPQGYDYSGIFGRSSNQEVWAGPQLEASPVDHFAFLHPHQSEAVIPEFGEVLVLSEGRIAETWHALSGTH
ncbi:alanine racemase [Pseudophaeobacter sp.]|uniref:alanine racemase n=1 Tax=Pseudophaeobacter sp. TaxID=1971739 RepID=UPI003299B858